MFYCFELARFLSRDMRPRDAKNQYAYAINNPLGFTDADGREEEAERPGVFDAPEEDIEDLKACIKRCMQKEYFSGGNALGEYSDCLKACKGTKIDATTTYEPVRQDDESAGTQDNPEKACPQAGGCAPLGIFVHASGVAQIKKVRRKKKGKDPVEYDSPFFKIGAGTALGKTGGYGFVTPHYNVELVITVKGDPTKCKITHEYFDKARGWVDDTDPYNTYISGNKIIIYDAAQTARKRRVVASSPDGSEKIEREYITFPEKYKELNR